MEKLAQILQNIAEHIYWGIILTIPIVGIIFLLLLWVERKYWYLADSSYILAFTYHIVSQILILILILK